MVVFSIENEPICFEEERPMPWPQPGILNRPPDHLIVAGFELTTADPAATKQAIERLRELVHAELRSDRPRQANWASMTRSTATTSQSLSDSHQRHTQSWVRRPNSGPRI
jgi:hypothetical protein